MKRSTCPDLQFCGFNVLSRALDRVAIRRSELGDYLQQQLWLKTRRRES